MKRRFFPLAATALALTFSATAALAQTKWEVARRLI